MIPIGLPSVEFLLIRLGYLLATAIWIIWTLRLAFNGKARGKLKNWKIPIFWLLSMVSIYSLWSVYAFSRDFAAYKAEEQEKYYPVLKERQRLGGIEMPDGTRLKLGVARQNEAFDRAELPHPISVNGVKTTLIERYLSIHTDKNHHTTGFTPKNLRLSGVGKSRQSGWICDASAAIVFETDPTGQIKALQSCTAAAGNLIEGEPLPEGAKIVASQGTVFLDSRLGVDRWLIHLPSDSRLMVGGTEQKGGAVLLDANHAVVKLVPQ